MKHFLNFFAVALFTLVGLTMGACSEDTTTDPEPDVPETPVEEQSAIRLSTQEGVFPSEGGSLTIVYSIVNEKEGATLTAECEADWLTINTEAARKVDFTATMNESGEARTATVTLKYSDAEPVEVTLSQEAYVIPIALEIVAVEDTKVTFSVTTTDNNYTWTGNIVGKEWFDEMGGDDVAIFEADYAYYIEMAAEYDMTIEEFIGQILNHGSYSSITFGGLDPQSEYVVYVYGMNNEGVRTSPIVKQFITTADPYDGPITFELDVWAEEHIIHGKCTPSHDGVNYWLDIMPTEELGNYALKPYAQRLINNKIQEYLDNDYISDASEYYEGWSSMGIVEDFFFEGFPNTEYIVYAAKWNENCELQDEVTSVNVTTGSIEPSDNIIEVTMGGVTATTLEFEVITSNDDPYVVLPIESSYTEGCINDDELFYVILNEWAGSAWNLGYWQTYGSIKGTMTQLEPDTDHVLYVFGYIAGTRTTAIQQFPFRTEPAGDPDLCEFEFEITNIKSRMATVSITPSDTSTTYYWDVFPADATSDDVVEKVETILDELYDQMEFGAYVSYLNVKEETIGGMQPSTEYRIACLPVMREMLYDKYGEMLGYGYTIKGDAVFSEIFTTKEEKVADLTITVNHDKYYDGAVLAEAAPDKYGFYIDRAVVPMSAKVEGSGTLDYYRYSMFEYQEGLEDPTVYSDELIIENLMAVGVNYDATFWGWWDTKMMIAAIAVDMDGNYSHLYREVVIFTHEGVSPPEEILGESTTSAVRQAMSVASGKKWVDSVKSNVARYEGKVFDCEVNRYNMEKNSRALKAAAREAAYQRMLARQQAKPALQRHEMVLAR